ncbi:MAG: ArnT family glycosyltransferase [Patescibacteria group bacterium]|jgi:4-amino-4-deoxy-L-arabinose transferase-like glycosyltransferase
MSSLLNFLKKHRLLIFILVLGLSFRFYNYPNRWVLNQDQARDVSIALYAIRNRTLPLLGSPSSAGPFNFGPLYDWLVIITTLLFPFTSGPWVAFTLLSTLVIVIFYLIGRQFADHSTGLIFALTTAFAAGPIGNAPDMLNTVIVLFWVSLAFLCLTFLITKKKIAYAIPLSFFIGAALNSHFQSLGLFALLLSAFLINPFNFKQKIQTGFLFLFGFLLAFLPLLVFDITHKWIWIKSVFAYYTNGQNKFHVPIRWLTDLRDFWPQLWGSTILDLPYAGYFFLVLFFVAIYLYYHKHRRLPLPLIILTVSLLIQVVLLRYYKGVRSREYLIVFHSYFIFYTGWLLSVFIHTNRRLGQFLIGLFLLISCYSNYKIIQKTSQAKIILTFKKNIDSLHLGNFEYYVKNSPNDQLNTPLFYLLYKENRINPSAYKIGTCYPKHDSDYCPSPEYIIHQSTKPPYILYNLSHLSSEDLARLGFYQYTPKNIYERLFVNYPQALNN